MQNSQTAEAWAEANMSMIEIVEEQREQRGKSIINQNCKLAQ